MLNTQGYSQYRDQKILTAGPGELLLMLFDGGIKELKLAAMAHTNKDRARFSQHLVKTQDILLELVGGLNFDYELSQSLYSLYEYMMHELMLANADFDKKRMEATAAMLDDLRQTWREVILQTRQTLPQTMAAGVSR